MIEVMRKIVSTTWPYPEILDSYSKHEGTLGGLIEALDKFESCIEKQEEKETIVNYKLKIEKIRDSIYDEILLNMNWLSLHMSKPWRNLMRCIEN